MIDPKNYSKKLDMKDEFNKIHNLIKKTWKFNCSDKKVESALLDAFNAGLHDGRMWIDQYLTYSAGEIIHGELCSPVEKRRELLFECGERASWRDALCIFDDALMRGLGVIETNNIGTFRFSASSAYIEQWLKKKYPAMVDCEPVEMSEDEQKSLVDNYDGFSAEGVRTCSTPERLSYGFVKYGKEEQGREFFYALTSSVYAHGLGCAQEYNDRQMLKTIVPIYVKYLKEPVNGDNADEIMSLARKNELFPFIETISKFKFYDKNEVLEIKKPVEPFDLDKFLEDLKNDEPSEEEMKKEENEIKLKIDTFKKTLPALKVNASSKGSELEM